LSALTKIQKPLLNAEEKSLEDVITELRKQLKSKEEELLLKSPYEEILQNAKENVIETTSKIEVKKSEIKEKEDELPYLDYWIKGFGDKGIRKFIIDKIVPALNNKLEYWMRYLMEDQIKIVFDNEFNEKIDQKPADGNPFVYYTLSNGEKQRINLSLALAFSYIRALNYGTCPSILFLDEITKGAIDKNGVLGLYNMILELAKERQVFITTHDVNLLNLLEGFDTIRLKKKDGFTTLVKK
jgi:DNA repair exonuclease SbcCD ATPase subunit